VSAVPWNRKTDRYSAASSERLLFRPGISFDLHTARPLHPSFDEMTKHHKAAYFDTLSAQRDSFQNNAEAIRLSRPATKMNSGGFL
jgi:hypothetical protein